MASLAVHRILLEAEVIHMLLRPESITWTKYKLPGTSYQARNANWKGKWRGSRCILVIIQGSPQTNEVVLKTASPEWSQKSWTLKHIIYLISHLSLHWRQHMRIDIHCHCYSAMPQSLLYHFGCTPATNKIVAALCRRSWKRISGKPASTNSLWNIRTTLSGIKNPPYLLQKTIPCSRHFSPAIWTHQSPFPECRVPDAFSRYHYADQAQSHSRRGETQLDTQSTPQRGNIQACPRTHRLAERHG